MPLLTLVFGCSCAPELPTPGPEDTTTPPPVDSADTGSAPPCDLPEVEPDDVVPNSYVLGLEACGVLDPPTDVDTWSFVLAEDAWLDVSVAAVTLGSLADVRLLLEGPDGAALQRDDDPGTNDPSLVFPAAAGEWTARLVDENLEGGERYGWVLFADVGKQPVAASDEEVEPNDLPVHATSLAPGAHLWGILDAFDTDWFSLTVPGLPGDPVHVVLSVDAFAWGSPADTQLFLVDDGLETVAEATTGLSAADRDPVIDAVLVGGSTFYVSVSDQIALGGPNYWYVLTWEAP
jgi:hypothetical protein